MLAWAHRSKPAKPICLGRLRCAVHDFHIYFSTSKSCFHFARAISVKLPHCQTRHLSHLRWHFFARYPRKLHFRESDLRPEKISRGLTLLRLILGILYVGIPHGFCLFFRLIASSVLSFLAWWAVLFSGHYPERWHAFNVGTFRWIFRVGLYLSNMTDAYPPFSGKE